MSSAKDPRVTSTDGHAPDAEGPAPMPVNPATGQHESYWILTVEERAKGFVRPVRHTYEHDECHTRTTMARDIAETYARQPTFYGATFCMRCKTHESVGPDGGFYWVDEQGRTTAEKVGT